MRESPRLRPPRSGSLTGLVRFIVGFLLVLALAGSGFSSQVTLAWDQSTDPQVVGYKLHYGTSSGEYSAVFDAGNQPAATLSGLQSGVPYFFAATAYDAYGNQSGYSAEVTYTLPFAQDQSMTLSLSPGWVLLSLPVQLSNPDAVALLAPLAGKYSVVWAYHSGQWTYYNPTFPAGSALTTMDAGSAYWIKMTSSTHFHVSGASASKNTNLTAGWNFVGYAGDSALPAASVLGSIDGKCDLVWTYAGGHWSYFDPTFPDGSPLREFQPGKGYWIKMRESAIWTLP